MKTKTGYLRTFSYVLMTIITASLFTSCVNYKRTTMIREDEMTGGQRFLICRIPAKQPIGFKQGINFILRYIVLTLILVDFFKAICQV